MTDNVVQIRDYQNKRDIERFIAEAKTGGPPESDCLTTEGKLLWLHDDQFIAPPCDCA